jgi:predicted PurR-regulated permease PerM
VKRYNLENEVDGLSDNLRERTKNIRQPVISTAGRIGSALIAIVTVLVLTFMMLVEGPEWSRRYWELHPTKDRAHDRKLAEQMYRVVTGYVNGQVLLAFIAASFAFVALLVASTLLNVSVNAAGLAGILVFTGLIPMIGHTIGGTLVTLACLFVSVPLAIIMAVYFILYQQIENVTLQPYIQAKYNELTPLLVFVAALLGVGFGGLLGAFVAIPAVGCIKILVLDYLARRRQGQAA